MMTAETLQQLLEEYVLGTILPEDRQRLLAALRNPALSAEAAALLLQELEAGRYDADEKEIPEVRDRLHQRLTTLIQASGTTTGKPVGRTVRFGWSKVAAAVLAVVGITAAIIYLGTRHHSSPKAPLFVSKEIEPGGNKALLTLSDGSTITLDQAANGTIAQQGNAQVIKLANGQLTYRQQSGLQQETRWNTVSTPAGGEYQVTLPDGTKAWLNAVSTIRFPTAFTGEVRQVTITGEVYLEVAPSARQPFTIATGNTVISVLGTSFNVNAYKEEAYTKITLVTGSIKIKAGDHEMLLKPGQQAASSNSSTAINVTAHADLDQVLAWKNGLFNFNGADLHTVMRQLERWYGINVRYEGTVPDIIFKGEMYKNVNLSDVLDMLKEMGIKFRIEEKTLIVGG